MKHIDNYSFYVDKETGMESFRDKLAQQEKNSEQKIQNTANKLLSDYRKHKQVKDETKKAFKIICTESKFKEIVESSKKNCANLKDARHIGSYLVLCPCIFFEYSYQKTSSNQERCTASTILSLFGPDPQWRPDLCKEIETALVNVPEGHIIECSIENAEQQIALLLAVAINDSSRFSALKNNLNIKASPKGIQSLLRVAVIYLPYLLAKFQDKTGIKYCLYDRFGKETLMNKKIVDNLEKNLVT